MPAASDAPTRCVLRASEWLAAHGDALFRYARLRLGDDAAAEDAVQDALVAAMASWDAFRGESSERTWLTGILKHKVIDALRARARETRWAENLYQALGGADAHFGARHGWASTPASVAASPESAELRSALWRAIADLPPAMREVFCLREIDGVPTSTICELLHLTPTNVWTLMHRAKLRLRDALAEQTADRTHGTKRP